MGVDADKPLTDAKAVTAKLGTGVADDTVVLRGDATWDSVDTAQLADNGVTYAKVQQLSTLTVLGNPTGGAANVQEISFASARGFLKSPYPLFDHYADAGNTTTTETDLYSDTTAAGQLGANGDKVAVEYGGTFVSSATATRQVRIYFAGTAIFDTGALTLSLSSAWTAYATVVRKDSATVRYMVSLTTEGAALSAYTAVGELGSLTLSGTNVLKVTGQAAGVGAATNDIVAKVGTVLFTPAA